ncbi:hypothetical protein [Nonomuraea rhodomycinica]|uniref:Uncharacterized protein n=1 Tax=Nonomuraea rhodomycinica TaxID=1712872 RepID=A0A7Y6MDE1_9ACTN|nr:hypothetical protein [Nonomuraea rhodomycinica]NUW42529.1 hypothetical protein [Nonomuraea rhodomycinica]
MDPLAVAAMTSTAVVLIVALAAVAIVGLTVRRADSADLPQVLDGIARVIRSILGKK